MTNPRVFISYDNLKTGFVKKFVDYLQNSGVNVVVDDPTATENRAKQELLSRQWLILVLTPEAARSSRAQTLVKAALQQVAQQSMQGVLALDLTTEPLEPEEMPPLWSTIPMYKAGQNDEEHQRAFEKVCRTLSYTKVPVLTGTSPTVGNGVSQFVYNDTRSSRPLFVPYQPAQRPRPRLISPLFVGLALLIILISFGGAVLVLNRSRATPTPNVNATSTAYANAASTAANATAKATFQISPLTPQQQYDKVTNTKKNLILSDPLSAQDNNNWNENTMCTFTNGMYHVSTSIGHYTPCMAQKTQFTNFAYQAKITFINGDAGGLIFRSDKGVSMFYRFSLDSAGAYKLVICQQCTSTLNGSNGSTILAKGQGLGINIGQPQTLTIIAINKTIYLYVNGMYIDKRDGPTTSSGEIGVYAVSQTQPTEVAFSDVKVWMLS